MSAWWPQSQPGGTTQAWLGQNEYCAECRAYHAKGAFRMAGGQRRCLEQLELERQEQEELQQ